MPVAILLSMFPELHETFIRRELTELSRQGLEFEIFSLQRPRDSFDSEAITELAQRTHYGSLLGLRTIAAFFAVLLRHPLLLLSAVFVLSRAGWRQPRVWLESLAILPLTLRFGITMREKGVDHVHGHWRNVPTTACWILHLVFGIRWSAAIHGEDIFSPNAFLRRKLADASFIVVCTGYSCRFLKEEMGLPRPQDIHLNYHGLDRNVWERAERFLAGPPCGGEQSAPPVILSIGRLVSFKGHNHLIHALHRLNRDHDVRLRIIGAGPEESNLRELVKSLELEAKVTFLGQCPFEKVLTELEQADLFALASVYVENGFFDGIPNVLAEAMAFELPVVSTRVSGIPELVEDGVSGLLVEDRNPEALAAALRQIIEDPGRGAALGKAAGKRVRAMFNQERNVSELMRIFEHYLAIEREH